VRAYPSGGEGDGVPADEQPRHSPDYDFTVEDYLVQLDKQGVQYGVIVGAIADLRYSGNYVDVIRSYVLSLRRESMQD
jgi:predicted TIM-barrel fold metal-dependent hydrolase